MAILPAGGVRHSNIPIFKAGPTAWQHDDREWTNKDIARLVTHTQAALKAGSLSIPLIIGHNEDTGEKPAMGLIVGIRKGTKVFQNPETGKRERIATILADMVMNPEMDKLYREGRYPERSVEIHENHVLPTAPGSKATVYPYVIKALAFLGGSAPAHGLDFHAGINPAALFAHDTDHEGHVFMYRVNKTTQKTEGESMPAENQGGDFTPEDMLAALQAIADIVNPALEAEMVEGEMEGDKEKVEEAEVDQNSAENSTDNPVAAITAQLGQLAEQVKGLTDNFQAKDAKAKAESDYKEHGNGIAREMWDPIAAKYGAKKAAEMFSSKEVGKPKGITFGANQGTTETQALEAKMEEMRSRKDGFYNGWPADKLKSAASRMLNGAQFMTAGRN